MSKAGGVPRTGRTRRHSVRTASLSLLCSVGEVRRARCRAGILQRVSQRLWQAQGCKIVAGQPTPWTHPQVRLCSTALDADRAGRLLREGPFAGHTRFPAGWSLICVTPAVKLLREGELQPGLSASEFAARRQQLADALPANGVAVLPAASQVFMSGAIPYPYRQVNLQGPPKKCSTKAWSDMHAQRAAAAQSWHRKMQENEGALWDLFAREMLLR